MDDSRSEIALEADDNGGRGKGSKQKIKKGKSKGDTETKTDSQVEDTEDKLLHEYQQQIAQEEERTSKTTRIKTEEESVSQTVTLNNDVGKKKKKKLKSVVTESDVGFVYLLIYYRFVTFLHLAVLLEGTVFSSILNYNLIFFHQGSR